MHHTVVWTQAAQDELAELWLQSNDRAAITRTSNQIDRALATDPDQKGVDFYGDRLLVVAPLRVVFVVRAADLIVEIQTVW